MADAERPRLEIFEFGDTRRRVVFVGTEEVSEGVEYDQYAFDDERGGDMIIVHVTRGHYIQLNSLTDDARVVTGFIAGQGELRTRSWNGVSSTTVTFHPEDAGEPGIRLTSGDSVTWVAGRDSDIMFYETREPYDEIPETWPPLIGHGK